MKELLLLAVSLVGTLFSPAQNPVHWKFSAIKMADKTYEIHLAARMQTPWHIYSQFTPGGGPVPTSIHFVQNPLVVLDGEIAEKGRLIKTHDDSFDVDIQYFSGMVDFVQKVIIKAPVKTSITGRLRFMACSETECLPPQDLPFHIDL